MSKQLPSPVSFAKQGKGGPSPVMLMGDAGRATPVSRTEALAEIAENERRHMAPSDRPTLHVEESVLTDGSIEFILKVGHRHVEGEIELRNEESGSSVIVTAVECWNLVAQDITDEQAQALGAPNAEALADDMGWHDDDWGVTPVTVIQLARA